jgi:hypothetical protein
MSDDWIWKDGGDTVRASKSHPRKGSAHLLGVRRHLVGLGFGQSVST